MTLYSRYAGSLLRFCSRIRLGSLFHPGDLATKTGPVPGIPDITSVLDQVKICNEID